MTNSIADASFIVAVLVNEQATVHARLRLATASIVIAPNLAMFECFNTFYKRYRLGELPKTALDQAPSLIRAVPTDVVPMAPLFKRAAVLSADLGHPIYDCVYLALAEREAATLLTCDRKLAQMAERLGNLDCELIAGE